MLYIYTHTQHCYTLSLCIVSVSDYEDKDVNSRINQQQGQYQTPFHHIAKSRKVGTCTTQTRVQHVWDECKRNGYGMEPFVMTSNLMKRILVDHKHHLVYCSVPKMASTTFRQFLWMLNVPDVPFRSHTEQEYHDKTGIRHLRQLSSDERKRVLKEYFKVIVVRHPFDRLYSAWKDKLSSRNSIFLQRTLIAANNYVKRVNLSRSQEFDQSRESITFQQFANLVSKRFNSGFSNSHWVSVYQHCLPCNIRYDHVIRLETLSRDVVILQNYLHMRNNSERIPLLAHDNNKRPIDSTEKMMEISRIYGNISSQTIQGLTRIYKRDMTLFGYHWIDRQASCSLVENNCC